MQCTIVTLLLLIAVCWSKPVKNEHASTVSINQLNHETTNNKPRSKRSVVEVVPIEVVPEEAVYDSAAAEADRELGYLTNEDWLTVAAMVQDIAQERAAQIEEAAEQLDLAMAEQALEEELEREAVEENARQQLVEAQVEEALANGEPVIILQNDTPQVQPVYVITDAAEPEDDPLIEELADELEAEAELRDHIGELTDLIHERYGA